MEKQVMVIEFNGDRVSATHYCGGRERSIEMHNFDDESDFLYCCAYLIDEMANGKSQIVERGFEGKTVCIEASENSGFTVGAVYLWENGRTADDNLAIYPKNYKIGASCAAHPIMTVGDKKFIVIKDDDYV